MDPGEYLGSFCLYVSPSLCHSVTLSLSIHLGSSDRCAHQTMAWARAMSTSFLPSKCIRYPKPRTSSPSTLNSEPYTLSPGTEETPPSQSPSDFPPKTLTPNPQLQPLQPLDLTEREMDLDDGLGASDEHLLLAPDLVYRLYSLGFGIANLGFTV